MASKQLGKLRQWAGEVISSREKTTSVTDEFRELEKDIELRRDGIARLYYASEGYHHALSKKKHNEALDDPNKFLPIETLGIIMLSHGEEFSGDSKFGTSLVALGKAHCQIAELQETFAKEFHETLIEPLEKFRDEFREYEQLRKKLESRRLTLDAALSKSEKVKKEKEKKDAEEELMKARLRYDETEQDVEAKMHSLQQNETDQLRILTGLLDLEVNYVEQYLELLKQTKSEWTVSSLSKRKSLSKGSPAPPSNKLRRPSSSSHSKPSMGKLDKSSSAIDSEDDSDDEPRHRRTESGATSKPASRSASKSSVRKRSDSTSTTTEKDKEEKDKPSHGRRISMAGWASSAVGSAVGSVASIGKMGKDKFTALYDDSGKGSEDRSGSNSPSLGSLGRRSSTKSKSATPILAKESSFARKKVVRAVHPFSGSNDELSFKTGDEITVVSEVLEEWWMGELDGKRGLFPTSYTEAITSPNARDKVHLEDDSEDEIGRQDTGASWRSSDLDEDEAWHAKPLQHNLSPLYNRQIDVASITSADEEDDSKLLPASFSRQPFPTSFGSLSTTPTIPPAIPIRAQSNGSQLTPKKAPPPPPPRRATTSQNTASPGASLSALISQTPPLLTRPSAFRANSQPLMKNNFLSTTPKEELDVSPFDSVDDQAVESPANGSGCDSFRQNPFKPKGMCSNCFQYHT